MKSNLAFRVFAAVVLATGMVSTAVAPHADVLFNVNSVADQIDDNERYRQSGRQSEHRQFAELPRSRAFASAIR